MTYFYTLSWWGLIVFVIIVFIIAILKYLNLDYEECPVGFWTYLLPHTLIDASIWPAWAIFGFLTEGQLRNIADDNLDSAIAGLVVWFDLMAWNYLKSGDAVLAEAAFVAITFAYLWRLSLGSKLIVQDPEKENPEESWPQ